MGYYLKSFDDLSEFVIFSFVILGDNIYVIRNKRQLN